MWLAVFLTGLWLTSFAATPVGQTAERLATQSLVVVDKAAACYSMRFFARKKVSSCQFNTPTNSTAPFENESQHSFRSHFLIIFGACIIGALLGTIAFASSRLLLVGGLLVAGLAGGGLTGIVNPWLPVLVGFCLCIFIARGTARRMAIKAQNALINRYAGTLPESQLQVLLTHEHLPRFQPCEQIVTMMFLDIVGFSQSNESKSARVVLTALEHLIRNIQEVIKAHGGIASRTPSGAISAVFGYNFLGAVGQYDHADRAVACSIKIQRDNLIRTLNAPEASLPVFPLRIGINTCGIYLGDVTEGEPLQLLTVGNGIKYAQRLEANCEGYRILVGPSTRDLLSGYRSISPDIRARLIPLKHRLEPIEAYELDPAFDTPHLLEKAIAIYQKYVGVERAEPRWPVPARVRIYAALGPTQGELVDFSLSGFAIKVAAPIDRGTQVNVLLDTPDGVLGKRATAQNLFPVPGVIRWCRASDGQQLVGVELQGVSLVSKQGLLDLLRVLITVAGDAI